MDAFAAKAALMDVSRLPCMQGKNPNAATEFLPDRDRVRKEQELREQLKKVWHWPCPSVFVLSPLCSPAFTLKSAAYLTKSMFSSSSLKYVLHIEVALRWTCKHLHTARTANCLVFVCTCLLQEYQAQMDLLKAEPLCIVYSYWDGAGHRREVKVKKGDTVGSDEALCACLRFVFVR